MKFLFVKRNHLIILALISTALLAAVMMKAPQGIGADSAWHAKALQQYLTGESPSINHLVTPKESNLSENKSRWIYWWPMGTQLLAYPLMAKGIALGDAFRMIALISIFAGTIGWVSWFSLFRIPKWIIVTLSIALPWLRYSSSDLFLYSPEILVYVSAPWILLAAYNLGEICKQQIKNPIKNLFLFVLFGFFLGATYILKYSVTFISLGAFLYLGLVIFRQKTYAPYKAAQVRNFIVAVIFFTIPIFLLNLLNYKLGGTANLVTAGLGVNIHWHNLLYIIAYPSLSIADAYSYWDFILFHTQYGILAMAQDKIWLGIIGLPGGILLLWLIIRPRIIKNFELLAISVLFCSSVSLYIIWTFSHSVSHTPRYLIPMGFTILPVVIQEGYHLWQNNQNRLTRVILVGAASLYIAAPLIFGPISVVGKRIYQISGYRTGPNHIYNPIVACVDLEGVRNRLLKDFSPDSDIWYFTNPISALSFPGRAIITFAEEEKHSRLRQIKYLTAHPLHIRALLPPQFEENGKGQIIRESFIQARKWKKTKIDRCNYVLWTTTLDVDSKKN